MESLQWKQSHQFVADCTQWRTAERVVSACIHVCRELSSLHIILSLRRDWWTQFLFSSVEKEWMSFSLQPRQIWNLILWGSEPRARRCVQAFKRDWGNPRSQSCCWCFEQSLAALPQAVLLLCCSKSLLGLFSEMEELLFFNNQEKQIPCVLLEGPCTEKKANENTNGSRSASPKHVKQCFKRYQQTVAAGKYSVKQLLHLCKIFMCIWNEVVPHNEE